MQQRPHSPGGMNGGTPEGSPSKPGPNGKPGPGGKPVARTRATLLLLLATLYLMYFAGVGGQLSILAQVRGGGRLQGCAAGPAPQAAPPSAAGACTQGGCRLLPAQSLQGLALGPEGRKRQLLEQEVADAFMAAADVEYAITQPAVAQGFVRKAGPTMLYYWSPANRTQRHQRFRQWMAEASEAPRGEAAAMFSQDLRLPNPPPLFPNCQVLVNHRYKFIYLRHPKSASTTLMTYFTSCGKEGSNASSDAVAAWKQGKRAGGSFAARSLTRAGLEGLGQPSGGGQASSSSSGGGGGSSSSSSSRGSTGSGSLSEPAEELGRRRGMQWAASGWDSYGLGAACLEPMSTLELSPEEVARIWSEYFVFTVVRNPYQRMLSSYKFLVHKTRAEPACKHRLVRWDEFCRDPLMIGRHCATQPACCVLPAGYYWHHVIDQGRCLEAEGGGWAADYIATVEQFDEHMQQIIAEIDRRRPEGLPPLRKVTGPLEQQNQAADQELGVGGPSCNQEELEALDLKPELTQTQVGDTWIPYNATVLLDRYCEAADYFRGAHEHCLLRGRHFYASDFEVLYGRPRQQQQQQPWQEQLDPA